MGKHKGKRSGAPKSPNRAAIQEPPVLPTPPYEPEQKMRPLEDRIKRLLSKGNTTDWLLTAFTGLLAAVAILQWSVTDRQLRVMRRDQRPWIKVEMEKHPIQAGSASLGILHLTNIGKTPAKNIDGRVFVEFLNTDESPHLNLGGPFSGATSGTLFPATGPIDMPIIRVSTGGKVAEFLTNDVNAYESGTKYIVIYAKVSYEDTSGIKGWTQFCAFDAAGFGQVPARKCTEYNNADSN
jgi:hypothetical protein